MHVDEANDWIGSLRRFGIKPGLERVYAVLSILDHPESDLSFYHVAGTNGKGSVCAMLTAMLEATGETVGLYTSPGLGGFNGRMTISGQEISDAAFARYAKCVREAMEVLPPQMESLTEFEVLTVMALLYFRDERVDAVVWETGLGGRYDATSVVQPLVTAITNVSFDHVAILGPTLADIAWDKAGIIKQDVPLVTAATGEAYRIIKQVASDHDADVIRVGRDVSMTRMPQVAHRETGYYRGRHRDATNVVLSLFGRHQLDNAAVALAMFEQTHAGCSSSVWQSAVKSLQRVRWPFRFEVFAGPQPVVLDGAHNPDAAIRLRDALMDFAQTYGLSDTMVTEQVNGKQNGWDMVFGPLADKDVRPMLQAVLPLAKHVTVCRPNHVRGGEPAVLARAIAEMRPDVEVTVISDVEAAVVSAWRSGRPLVIWGSLYMAEDARKAIVKLEMDYWI